MQKRFNREIWWWNSDEHPVNISFSDSEGQVDKESHQFGWVQELMIFPSLLWIIQQVAESGFRRLIALHHYQILTFSKNLQTEAAQIILDIMQNSSDKWRDVIFQLGEYAIVCILIVLYVFVFLFFFSIVIGNKLIKQNYLITLFYYRLITKCN